MIGAGYIPPAHIEANGPHFHWVSTHAPYQFLICVVLIALVLMFWTECVKRGG